MTGPGHAGSTLDLPLSPELGLIVLGVGFVVLLVIGYDAYRTHTFGVDG